MVPNKHLLQRLLAHLQVLFNLSGNLTLLKNHVIDQFGDNYVTIILQAPYEVSLASGTFSWFDFDVSDTDNISFESSLDIIASCIDVVYNEEESWAASDCTKKELNEWLETLNSNQFKEVETFFETMPKLSHTVKVVNPKTKVESDVALEGITSFFG